MENALTNAASQSNFTGLDWGIVVVYLLLSVGVAFFVKRYAVNMTTFVGAGRAVGGGPAGLLPGGPDHSGVGMGVGVGVGVGRWWWCCWWRCWLVVQVLL